MNPMGFTFLYLIALLFSLVVAYLCGSIPFAIIIGKGIFGVDVRQHGSGNTGSTNVMRVLGVKAGIVVFICDTAKGAIAVLAGMGISHLMEMLFLDGAWHGLTMLTVGWTYQLLLVLCALAAIVGHMYSPFLSFHGGKGVATALGGVFAILPLPALCALGVFAVVAVATRYVSLASISAAVSLPLFVWLLNGLDPLYIGFACCVMVALIYAHRSNIGRLLNHTEKKFAIEKVARDDGAANDVAHNVPDDGFHSGDKPAQAASEGDSRTDGDDDGGGEERP